MNSSGSINLRMSALVPQPNQIRVSCRSRFYKFKDLRAKIRKQENFDLSLEMDPTSKKEAKKKAKQVLLNEVITIEEEGGREGQRPLWMSGVEEIKLDVSEIQSRSNTKKKFIFINYPY